MRLYIHFHFGTSSYFAVTYIIRQVTFVVFPVVTSIVADVYIAYVLAVIWNGYGYHSV